MKKKIKESPTYTILLNKLLKWKWPEWPKDNPLGCANLLVEQAKAINPYFLPIVKQFSSAGYSVDPYYHLIVNQIISSNVISKLTTGLENWINECPFLQTESKYILFSSTEEIPSEPTWLNKLYFTNFKLFLVKKPSANPKETPQKIKHRRGTENWAGINNLLKTILKYSNVVQKGKVILLVDTEPTKDKLKNILSKKEFYATLNSYDDSIKFKYDVGEVDE